MAQQHDIEDVLSSIRRLVASDTMEFVTTEAAAATARQVPDGPTLVLDPAQRVIEPEDPFQMIRTLAQEERDGRDAEHITSDLPEDVTAITEDLDDTLPEELEASSPWEEAAAPALPGDYAEDTDYEAEDGPRPQGTVPDEVAPSEAQGTEPDRGKATSPTSEPEAVQDADAPNTSEQPETAATTEKNDTLSTLSESIGDDDALRDLIADIVRQELAGELGERITRNVRKLVRREIRMLLASDEFD